MGRLITCQPMKLKSGFICSFLPCISRPGALISDGFLGKYKIIITLSLVYTLGHFALSLDDSRVGLAIGLSLIAIGAGLMPNISWQILAYSVLTSAEVMIYINCLEF